MPSLRPLDSVASSLELRSSKTLIGSGNTTCDVVVPDALELHALLNLGEDKNSAKLVPFSTTDAGVCYVNDGVVPREGALVVNGDRVAFGNPSNAFVFELASPPQPTAVSPTRLETNAVSDVEDNAASPARAFRKALDALRGDRKPTTPSASVAASIQSNMARKRDTTSSLSSSASSIPSLKSKKQLNRFLVEASTDSLLNDYVERKLKQWRIPRSKSPSVASSTKSEASIQSRTPSRSVRQSTNKRNLAEVEKLRLSQRIREVNDVLNGDLDFDSSYLSDNNNKENSDDEDEDEDEDELPAMMEKAPLPPVLTFKSVSASTQTENSEQERTHRLERMAERYCYKANMQRCSRIFTSWRQVALELQNQRLVLRKLLAHGDFQQTQRAWSKWIENTLLLRLTSELNEQHVRHIQQTTDTLLDRHHKEQLSLQENHVHQIQTLMELLEEKDDELNCQGDVQRRSRFFTRWRQVALQGQKRRLVLRKLLSHGASRLVQRAWLKWIESTILIRVQTEMKARNEDRIQQTTDSLVDQHNQAQLSQQEDHAYQLQKLMQLVEEKDQELKQLQQQLRADALEKAAAKVKCEQDINTFFQETVVKCDEQISDANDQLETLLQTVDDDVLGARFGAAQYLLNVILQQKISNANEQMRLQAAHLKPLPLSNDPIEDDPTSKLSSNGRFLHDMAHQRLTRLQQLHRSFAKLASVSDVDHSLDSERLRHGLFLSDAIYQRQQRHLSVMAALYLQSHH